MRLVILACGLLVAVFVTIWVLHQAGDSASKAAHPTLTTGHIRQLAALATTRIESAVIVSRRLEGATGSLHAVIAVRGDVLLGVDLSEARIQKADAQARTAIIVLPQPRVLAVSLDHRQTVVHTLAASGTWLLLPPSAGRGDLITQSLAEAHEQLRVEASTPVRLDAARHHADAVIKNVLRTNLGWNVHVQWQ